MEVLIWVLYTKTFCLSVWTLHKVADYFDVSVDRVLTGRETKKAPAPEDGREVQKEDLMAAFWGGDKDMTPEELDAMWRDVERFAAFVAEQKRRERGKPHD